MIRYFFNWSFCHICLGKHSGWLFINKSHRTTRNIKVEPEEKYDSCYLVLWAISWWQGLLLGISRSQGQVWSAEMREASCNAAPRGTTRPEGRSGTRGETIRRSKLLGKHAELTRWYIFLARPWTNTQGYIQIFDDRNTKHTSRWKTGTKMRSTSK